MASKVKESGSSHISLRAKMERFLDFINSGDQRIGMEVVSDKAIFHAPLREAPLVGLAGYMEILGMMRGAFPDVQWTLEETIVEDNVVAARFTIQGTHRGEFLGAPATGKSFISSAMNIYRFDEGMIVGEHGQPDLLGIMAQIGMVKLPGP